MYIYHYGLDNRKNFFFTRILHGLSVSAKFVGFYTGISTHVLILRLSHVSKYRCSYKR